MIIKRAFLSACAVAVVFASGADAEELKWGAPARIVPEDVVVVKSGIRMATQAPLSGNPYVNSLLYYGYKWSQTTITYSFYNQGWDSYGGYYDAETGVTTPSAAVQDSYRQIFAELNNLMAVTFVERVEDPGDNNTIGHIRIQCADIYDDEGMPIYAYAYLPTDDPNTPTYHGDIFLSNLDDVDPLLGGINSFQSSPGTHGYMAMIHELGHALGLKHPHDEATYLYENNNLAWTVMTYNGDNSGSSSATFMYYDVMALQYLYGAKTFNETDTTYSFTRIDTFTSPQGKTLINSDTTPYRQILHDSGGTDTLDISGLPDYFWGYCVDLDTTYSPDTSGYEWGAWITYLDEQYTATENLVEYDILGNEVVIDNTIAGTYFNTGVAIGPGTIIENTISSSSDDYIFANDAANIFGGYAPGTSVGDDVIFDADNMDRVELSAYGTSYTVSDSGMDIIISLGVDGSITIKDYYLVPEAERITFNDPPVVTPITYDIGTDVLPFLTNPIDFASSATDPEGDSLTLVWSATPSAGVIFTPNGAANTAITFPAQGTYTIQFSADDPAHEPVVVEVTLTVYDPNGDEDGGVGDGILDYWEVLNGLDENDPLDAGLDPDNDNLTSLEEYQNLTEPFDADSDDDGLLDGEEVNGIVLPVHGLTTSDPLDADTDDDTLTDFEEMKIYFTDPNDADSDGDTMPDVWEVSVGILPNVDDAALDPDTDLLTNIIEYRGGVNPTHPMDSDTDDDGLMDGAEDTNLDGVLDPTETDPLNWDTDSDSMPDGWEVANPPLDPLYPADGTTDLDNDGVANEDEYDYGTDPNQFEEFGVLGVVGASGCVPVKNGNPLAMLFALGVMSLVLLRIRRVELNGEKIEN